MTDPDSAADHNPDLEPRLADAPNGTGGNEGMDGDGRAGATADGNDRVEPTADSDADSTADSNADPTADNGAEPAADGAESESALEAFREPEPIEPESPRMENAVFVLLGVLATVALLATAIVPGVL